MSRASVLPTKVCPVCDGERYEEDDTSPRRFACRYCNGTGRVVDAQAAEELDNAAWAHARIRNYADSGHELEFVLNYKLAALGESREGGSAPARAGYAAGLRHHQGIEACMTCRGLGIYRIDTDADEPTMGYCDCVAGMDAESRGVLETPPTPRPTDDEWVQEARLTARGWDL